MTDPPDFVAEGLLDGLEEDRARDARRRLLEEMYAEGFSLEELREAVAEDRLTLLPVELVLGGRPRHTPREIAAETGLDVEVLMRNWQALGMPRRDPDERVMTDADLASARRSRTLRDAGFPAEAELPLLRVLGRVGVQVAETIRDLVGEALVRPGDTEYELGRRYAAFARQLEEDRGATMVYVTDLHLREQLRAVDITRAELESGRLVDTAREVAVSFADMVGFTRLGASIPVSDLGQVAERLADLAGEIAEPPVRLVKTIGDAAMLVSPEARPLLDATLRLVEAADEQEEDFPQLRAGVALGPAVNRAGDWYGHTVNLASRVTGIARPSSVLATPEVRDALGDDAYRWSATRERRLKGIKRPIRLFRVRPERGADA